MATKQPAKKAASKKSAARSKKLSEDDFNYERPLIDPPEEDKKKKSKAAENSLEDFVEVLKATISNDIFLSASWKVRSKDDTGTYDKDGENPVHDDLKKAFKGLDIHLASMAEQFNDEGELDKSKITCRGFSIGSNGQGVTLHGTRLLSNGKPFNYNTPFYKWDTEKSELLFAPEDNDLKSAINICRAEVIQYLFNHKYQPPVKQEEKAQ